MIVTAARLWSGSGENGAVLADSVLELPVLEIEDGRITAIWSQQERALPVGVERIDFPGATLAPSFMDVHMHGGAGRDLMEATPEALSVVGRFVASRGTANYLATTVTAPMDVTLKSLSELARRVAEAQSDSWQGARPLGIHLEGPFLSHGKRGVHPPDLLLVPEIATFQKLYDAAEGKIRLMTLAPELPGAVELAAYATSLGVRVSVGHSNATAAETRAAIAAGATSATHTFNAMRALDHREPGILGVVLSTDSLYAELICDGIHVDPSLVKVWYRAKGKHRGILVTDAMMAAGMPDGDYTLGQFAVQVKDGKATANGVLAGSVLSLDRALANFVAYTGESVANSLPLLTENPAAMSGFSEQAGRITVGGRADLVAVGDDGKLLGSFVGGRLQDGRSH
jgi:N-acetylglucosamine-6-phosphate deacetylase